jgi:hypothetical protein
MTSANLAHDASVLSGTPFYQVLSTAVGNAGHSLLGNAPIGSTRVVEVRRVSVCVDATGPAGPAHACRSRGTVAVRCTATRLACGQSRFEIIGWKASMAAQTSRSATLPKDPRTARHIDLPGGGCRTCVRRSSSNGSVPNSRSRSVPISADDLPMIGPQALGLIEGLG